MTSAQTSQSNSVFVDSSVLIAAAISANGAARELLLRGFRCDLVLYISDDVLMETERNLTRKAPEAVGAFCAFRDLLAARLVKPTPTLVTSTAKVVEFKDAPIVAAADSRQSEIPGHLRPQAPAEPEGGDRGALRHHRRHPGRNPGGSLPVNPPSLSSSRQAQLPLTHGSIFVRQ